MQFASHSCVSRKGGRGVRGWGHPNGDMPMAATFLNMVAQMAGLLPPCLISGGEGPERVFVCQPRMLAIASLLLST